MIEYLTSPGFKSHLENLYFISGVVLAAGLLIGIWQLRQQKRISRTANRREAFRIAAERCEYFGRVLLPEAIALKIAFKEADVALFDKCSVEVTEDGIKMLTNHLEKEDGEAANKFSDQITKLLNSLEGFAIFFVTGVADDKVGFLTCGKAFTQLFEDFFPVYALSGSLDDSAQATQALYGHWKSRLRQIELAEQKAAIEAKLQPNKLKPKIPYGG